jgi:hypothetical protein
MKSSNFKVGQMVEYKDYETLPDNDSVDHFIAQIVCVEEDQITVKHYFNCKNLEPDRPMLSRVRKIITLYSYCKDWNRVTVLSDEHLAGLLFTEG